MSVGVIMKITTKLGLVVFCFVVPMGYITHALYKNVETTIAFSAKEAVGVNYLRGVSDTHFKVAQGELGMTVDLSRTAASLIALEQSYGDGMESASQSTAAIDGAKAVSDGMSGDEGSATRAALRALTARIGDKSNLILDPDLDSFYVMDLTVVKIPDAIDRVTNLALASKMAFADTTLDENERLDLVVQMGGLQSTLDGINGDVDSAYLGNGDGSLKLSLNKPLSAVQDSVHSVVSQWTERAATDAEVRSAVEALSNFYAVNSNELERLLKTRIQNFRTSELKDIGLSVGFFVAILLIVLFIIRTQVTRPILKTTDLMEQLSKGNYDIRITDDQRDDEIGQMSRALRFFQNNLVEAEQMKVEEERKIQSERIRQEKLNKIFSDFENKIGHVVSTVTDSSREMRNFAQTLTQTADQTGQRATSVAAASEQAAANVATVAAATEELSSSIHEITRQVADSATTASAAVEEVKTTNITVASMAEAAQRIGDVVQLISDIANQTNLLALNATIEAARAGEAGKGFAVVASEVKNLANQTAKATEDITAQIEGIQTVAKDAVSAIQSISNTIERMNGITTTIAAAVEEQGAATAEISRNVQEAATGTQEVSSNIGGVTEATSETGQVAGQVLESASKLASEADMLHSEVERFIASVRSA